MTFPVGGGFAYAYKAFIVDARAGWTGTYYQNLLVGAATSNTLDHWNVGGRSGSCSRARRQSKPGRRPAQSGSAGLCSVSQAPPNRATPEAMSPACG